MPLASQRILTNMPSISHLNPSFDSAQHPCIPGFILEEFIEEWSHGLYHHYHCCCQCQHQQDHLCFPGIVLGMVRDRAANGSLCLLDASVLITILETPSAQGTCWAQIFSGTRHKLISLHGVFTEHRHSLFCRLFWLFDAKHPSLEKSPTPLTEGFYLSA